MKIETKRSSGRIEFLKVEVPGVEIPSQPKALVLACLFYNDISSNF